MKRVHRSIGAFIFTMLAAGLLTTTMVRFSPGYSSEEELLDPRLNQASLSAIREQHDNEASVVGFYVRHVAGFLRGDLGNSYSMRRPVRELLATRFPVTLRLLALGITGGWCLGVTLAIVVVVWRSPLWDGLAACITGLLLSLPSAVLALVVFYRGGPGQSVIALVLFPKIFQYVRNILSDARQSQHVLAACAKGIGACRLLVWHIVPVSLPQFLALAGVSLSVALSATIPIEVICDLPGIGQLAWKAALARDLPLLVDITLLIVLFTQCGNMVADCAIAVWKRHS